MRNNGCIECIMGFVFTAMMSLGLQAQERLEPHYVTVNPPQDWQFQKSGNRSWVLTDGKTEFNVILYKVDPKFNADSLRYLALDLYKDPNLQNVQAMEVNSGTLNGIKADRVVISFLYGDSRYLSTIYLAYFHINHQFNSVLFYFEIGEGNAVSYVGLQDQLLSSLKYLPFEYNPIKSDGYELDVANHWLQAKPENDSMLGWFTDGRANIRMYKIGLRDSFSSKTIASLTREGYKKMEKDWKISKEKGTWSGLDLEGMAWEKDQMEGVRWYYLTKVDSTLQAYMMEGSWPTSQKEFYADAWKKAWNSLKLAGAYLP